MDTKTQPRDRQGRLLRVGDVVRVKGKPYGALFEVERIGEDCVKLLPGPSEPFGHWRKFSEVWR